jgi:tetratricopeptide (TPR) repeat protein
MRFTSRSILGIVTACVVGGFGCAARRSNTPPPRPVSAASVTPVAPVPPVRTEAELTLEEITPPAVLPAPRRAAQAATRPATGPSTHPTTRPSTNPAGPNRPPLEALTLYAEACDNLLKHRRLAAVSLLEKAVALDPDSFELHYALGKALLGPVASDHRSIAELERAAEIDPDHVELQTDLGRQYLVRGEADKALWHLRLALVTSDYATDEADAAVTELFAGRALARAGYHTAAVQVYDRLLRRLETPSFAMRADPEVAYLLVRPELLRLQAAESFEKVGRYEEALRTYDAAAARDPNELALRARAVRVLLAMRRFDDAVARAADAVAHLGPGAGALDLLKEACRASGNEDQVVEQLQRLRRQRPRDNAVLYALADVLRGEGRSNEAFDFLRPAAEANPPRAEAVGRMYRCAVDLDRTGRAAARFLIGWSARHPDGVHLLSGLWDDLLRPGQSPRVGLRMLESLAPGEPAGRGAPERARWEAARWFWVTQVAKLRHRQDVARAALRSALSGDVVFAPAFRSASGRAAQAGEADEQEGDSAPGVDAPVASADDLAKRAAAAGDAALAAELRGLALLNQKQYAAARKQLDEAANLGGASPDLHFARAIAARGAGDDAEFESLLWKLAGDWPNYENAYEALYAFYSARGAENLVARTLWTWLTADRENVTARLLQARENFRNGRTTVGERLLDTLLTERGDDARVLATARSYYTQAGKVDAFVTKLTQRHAAAPGAVAVAAQLADLLAEKRRLAEAAGVLDATRAALADDPDLLYEVAHLYERIDQKAVTEQVLRELLRLDPSHASAANDLGYTLAEDGRDLEEAETLVRRAVQRVPGNASFLDSLGWVLYKRGRFDEARRSLLQAVGASKAGGGDPDPLVLDHLGDAIYRAGDGEGAAARWNEAIRRLAAGRGAGREELKALRLQLERKTKQAAAGQPVTVAPVGPVAEGQPAPVAAPVPVPVGAAAGQNRPATSE